MSKRSKKKKPVSNRPGLTWEDFHTYTSTLAAAMTQRANSPLPVKQLPTAEIDLRCDEWFEEMLWQTDGEELREKIENAPLDLAPWLAVRLIVASAVAAGNVQANPHPPKCDSVIDLADELLIEYWDTMLKPMWLGFRYLPGGILGCDGDDTARHFEAQSKRLSVN